MRLLPRRDPTDAVAQSRRLSFWARVVLVPVAVIGAVLSFRSLYEAAKPTFGPQLGAGFPLLVDLLILGASLQYVAGAKVGRPMAGWRLTAHAGVVATLVLNALAARELGEVPWHVTAPAVWAVLVELTAKQVLGEWKASHTAARDRISFTLWLTAPFESARTRLLMLRTGLVDAGAARNAVGVHAAAREALRLALPSRRGRRVRKVIHRQLRAGSLPPASILRPLGWGADGEALNDRRPETILQAVLHDVLDSTVRPAPVETVRPQPVPDRGRGGRPVGDQRPEPTWDDEQPWDDEQRPPWDDDWRRGRDDDRPGWDDDQPPVREDDRSWPRPVPVGGRPGRMLEPSARFQPSTGFQAPVRGPSPTGFQREPRPAPVTQLSAAPVTQAPVIQAPAVPEPTIQAPVVAAPPAPAEVAQVPTAPAPVAPARLAPAAVAPVPVVQAPTAQLPTAPAPVVQPAQASLLDAPAPSGATTSARAVPADPAPTYRPTARTPLAPAVTRTPARRAFVVEDDPAEDEDEVGYSDPSEFAREPVLEDTQHLDDFDTPEMLLFPEDDQAPARSRVNPRDTAAEEAVASSAASGRSEQRLRAEQRMEDAIELVGADASITGIGLRIALERRGWQLSDRTATRILPDARLAAARRRQERSLTPR